MPEEKSKFEVIFSQNANQAQQSIKEVDERRPEEY
jgi:hypothetical protein